jgi:photosystem II stability/assembly factor-like uncharacterized protein
VHAVFGSNGSAWVLDHKGQLRFTRDAGKSWTIMGGEVVKNFDMFTMAQGRVGLAADSDGQVWRSDDGGQSWTSISTLKRSDPAEHYMMASQIQLLNDGSKAWIVDTFAVWSTTDGGRSWQEVNDLSFRVQKKQVRRISFLSSGSSSSSDSSLGWAVADGGLILQTKDGGVSWQAIGKDLPVNVGTSINALKFVSPEHGWLALTDPSEPLPERVVLSTNDGGNSWQRQKEIKDNVLISSIFFLDSETGWMVGGEEVSGTEDQRGLLFKSSNGGRTWERARALPATDAIRDVYFSSPNEGWFFTDYDLFRTNDGGKSWTSVLSFPEVRQRNVEKLGAGAGGH